MDSLTPQWAGAGMGEQVTLDTRAMVGQLGQLDRETLPVTAGIQATQVTAGIPAPAVIQGIRGFLGSSSSTGSTGYTGYSGYTGFTGPSALPGTGAASELTITANSTPVRPAHRKDVRTRYHQLGTGGIQPKLLLRLAHGHANIFRQLRSLRNLPPPSFTVGATGETYQITIFKNGIASFGPFNRNQH